MGQTWINISTSSTVDPDTDFATPSVVMQTAVTTLNTTQPLNLYWSSDNKSTVFYVILHISEIEDIPSTALRDFDIYANGDLAFSSIVPKKLHSWWASYTTKNQNEYNVSLYATSNSTLPPLLNAIELYVRTTATGIPTKSEDGMFYHS